MKVVLIFPSILTYGIELANALSRENEVIFITNSSGEGVLRKDQIDTFEHFLQIQLRNNIRVVALPNKRLRDLRGWIQIIKLVSDIKNCNPDVIHINQTSDPRFCLLLLLLHKEFPIILTIHDVIWQHGIKPNLADALRNVPIKMSTKIVVHGESLKQLFIKTYPRIKPEKIYVVPHGPYNFYKQWVDISGNMTKGSILFFGRMLPYKGLGTIDKVAHLLENSCPNVKIIIAGTGPELDKRLSSFINRSNIIIKNHFIENFEVAQLFYEASIVALPYEEASQSGVAAIAVAFNKPIVATDVGALSEMIINGKTGFIVPSKRPDIFADKLRLLLENDGLMLEMEQNTYDFSQKISWENIAKMTTNIYMSCSN